MHSHIDIGTATSIERKPRSLVVVTGEVPYADLIAHEAHVLEHLGKDMELKGFRKGHVPPAMVKKQIGEMALLSELAQHVLADIYPEILAHYKIDAIGRPRVNITKLAANNPLGFTLEISVMPEVTLPDYKEIAARINKEKEMVTVSEKEVEEGIERIQRQKMAYDRIQAKAQARKDAEKDGLTPASPDTPAPEEDVTKLPVPELTDEYVKTLGAFDSVEVFKRQIREHLEREKMQDVQSKHRGALTDALITGSTIDLPEILIQSEIAQIKGQMADDLKRAGLTVEGYLEHMKKTMEDMEKEWTPTAETRAKTQLVLNEIAKRESIEPNKDDVVRDMGQLMAQFKDADPVRVRVYVESVLRNNEVMKFLENQ